MAIDQTFMKMAVWLLMSCAKVVTCCVLVILMLGGRVWVRLFRTLFAWLGFFRVNSMYEIWLLFWVIVWSVDRGIVIWVSICWFA